MALQTRFGGGRCAASEQPTMVVAETEAVRVVHEAGDVAGPGIRPVAIACLEARGNGPGGDVMVCVVANQKGGVGKTTTAVNVAVLLARCGERVLVIDADPQFALTRQLGLEAGSFGANLVDMLAGRASAQDAIVSGVYGVDVIPGARELAGIEMSLVGELARERFLRDALAPIVSDYERIVIDTPPNLGLLTVNALVCADTVIAPVSGEDDASVHGILELRRTILRLAARLDVPAPVLVAVLTRWAPRRVSSRRIESALIEADLAPVARVRSRSAAVARAAECGVPLAVSDPDGSVALVYRELISPLSAGAGV
jgi:chromosome partitioning protein